ncbi:unnamed protein product [Nezara viridula]|uniref:Uncharacterized protein n=1 Tax=Nezara viridula TaxID=85310 RepID=A0A9P0MPW7_NEZVI|nr:unnamed protein product [Nezara viridula]
MNNILSSAKNPFNILTEGNFHHAILDGNINSVLFLSP